MSPDDDTSNNDEATSDGTDADDSTTDDTTGDNTVDATESTDQTATAVTENDPMKNKKLAEITMSEPLRDLMTFEITLPGIYKGMHTNQFLWMDVDEDFYDDFYSEIADLIGESRFNRYTGFKEGRFYIQKKTWTYNLQDGVTTELELNPFPSTYSEYMKYQLQAENDLDQAVVDATQFGGNTDNGGTLTDANGEDCDASNTRQTLEWSNPTSNPPTVDSNSVTVRGNSSRQYAKDTAQHNSDLKTLIEYVKGEVKYQNYSDNPKGEERCPENMWTGSRPIRGNCADFARMLKCILDVNGYQSTVCHVPNHYYNAVWQNNKWIRCDLCTSPSYDNATCGGKTPTGGWPG